MSNGCLHTRMRAGEYLTTLHWLHPTTMCAVEESTPDDQRIWFVWREGKQIILWDEPDMPLAASRRILRIPKDVVATPARIKGSAYKVTQAWVNELEARCKNQGITFSVKGSPPSRPMNGKRQERRQCRQPLALHPYLPTPLPHPALPFWQNCPALTIGNIRTWWTLL
jgi:hypothetical protein